MKTIAVDCSSQRGSLAFVDGAQNLYEADWEEHRCAGTPLLEHLAQGMSETGWSWEQIDQFVAGRGPGNYTGLRISLAVIQALALPGNTRIRCLASGFALAEAACTETNEPRVAVLGNARRGELWHAVFERTPDHVIHQLDDWRVFPCSDFDHETDPSMPFVSSCRSWFVSNALLESMTARRWLNRDVFPSAAILAAVDARRLAAGLPSEPATPLYPHPAVQPHTKEAI